MASFILPREETRSHFPAPGLTHAINDDTFAPCTVFKKNLYKEIEEWGAWSLQGPPSGRCLSLMTCFTSVLVETNLFCCGSNHPTTATVITAEGPSSSTRPSTRTQPRVGCGCMGFRCLASVRDAACRACWRLGESRTSPSGFRKRPAKSTGNWDELS